MNAASVILVIYFAICTTMPSDSVVNFPGVEHRVTETDAMAAAKTLTPDLMVGIGCRNCSSTELAYCDSPDVISDHCCCDRRFHEVFPYIPHTCYLSDRHCQTVATHCGEFARLVLCCCHRLLASKWQKIANGSHTIVPGFWLISCFLILTSLLGRTSAVFL